MLLWRGEKGDEEDEAAGREGYAGKGLARGARRGYPLEPINYLIF